MKPLKIVFMGTPEFAVPMLDALLGSTHTVVGVVTAPDKPGGRGMQLMQSEVKKRALEKGLHILQPEKLRNENFLTELKSLNADLFVVVAFRMLPEVVWNMPPLGTINLHASLLPQYRGAAPINWAIINGETETGVTTFFIQHEIDTGKIIYSAKTPIRPDETVGELYQELMQLGARVLRQTIDAIAEGNYPQTPQDHITDIKHAPKIFKDDCKIDWSKSVDGVYNFIRGLSPYPAAFTQLNGKTLKVFKAEKHITDAPKPAGTFETDGTTYLRFYAANGYLSLTDLQLEGKKRMGIAEFLRGYKVSENNFPPPEGA
ncbi:MAG TPA: methionyl-tRNA formyltransferase [Chitinophagales bacterium]|nr:methionyl-tRNA formyltransferase [Chitinophagales bacterium]